MDTRTDRRWWDRLDSPQAGRTVFRVLAVVCAGLLLADFFYPKHAEFSWEGWFGFYGVYGFLGCVFLVLAAKEMRRVVKRDEDYYDRPDA
jgi:Na+/melibiose symporter-like transporter